MVEMGGIDLRCGAGRVAALTRPRRVINYHSRSIPTPMPNKKTPAKRLELSYLNWFDNNDTVSYGCNRVALEPQPSERKMKPS